MGGRIRAIGQRVLVVVWRWEKGVRKERSRGEGLLEGGKERERGRTNQVPSSGLSCVAHLVVGSEDEEDLRLGRHFGGCVV